MVKCQVKFFIPGVLCILCSRQVPLQAKTAPATITSTTHNNNNNTTATTPQKFAVNIRCRCRYRSRVSVAVAVTAGSVANVRIGQQKKIKKKNKIVFCALAFCRRVCLLLLRIRQSYLRRVVQTEITKTTTTTQFTIKITRALRQKYLQDTHTHTRHVHIHVQTQAQYAQNSTKMQHITAVKSFTIQP